MRPNLPIENLFEQINNAVEYAAAGKTPYTLLQSITTAYQLISNTGTFTQNCNKWRQNSAVDKTWTTFCTFFTKKHMDFREEHTKKTAKGTNG